jgi:hypothetical protein
MAEPKHAKPHPARGQVLRLLTGLLVGPGAGEPLPTQGYRRLSELIHEEWERPTFGLLRLFRLGILIGTYASPTLLVDQLFKSTSRSVVGLSRELLYQLPRDVFFLAVLVTRLHQSPTVMGLVAFLVLDILVHLAGSALVWGSYSIDPQRSLIWAVVNYFEITVAYAALYVHCDCFNVAHPGAIQGLYFSLVTATTVGFGDLYPKGSVGQAIVASQLGIFVVFVLVVLTSLQSRASQSTR